MSSKVRVLDDLDVLATDRGVMREQLTCNSISKEAPPYTSPTYMRLEVAIMESLPDHPTLVRPRTAYDKAIVTYEDEEAS